MQKSLTDLGVAPPAQLTSKAAVIDAEDGLLSTAAAPMVAVVAAPTMSQPQSRAKFIGGGFNLSQPLS